MIQENDDEDIEEKKKLFRLSVLRGDFSYDNNENYYNYWKRPSWKLLVSVTCLTVRSSC
jgi:hypothetical protein